ncbi:hypothetical protein DM02DRAFT_618335 [Periconia macrospinosa]|uniref:Uncharacterized protein n=1 Tax=Periconia macrospinosa TaxID=97972 RepID=A0A2V1DCB7_9PLEO|nr:hypothetical protein DM02DRAFT_618335 [Periconia macrospinosa]
MFEPNTPEESLPEKTESKPSVAEDIVEIRDAQPEKEVRSKSPEQDIDFAATVAAGLQESGFDSNLVLNDPTFHGSTSPPGQTRDISPEEDILAAKEIANKSKFGKLSRSPSPTNRDVGKVKSEEPQSTETLIFNANEGPATFNPMDILSDPTFSQRKTPPGVLEEADPDELWSSSKKGKKNKKKQRASTFNIEPEKSDEISVSNVAEPEVTVEMQQKDSTDLVQSAPITEQEPEDLWASTTTKKGKKAKKNKKQTPLEQEKEGTPAVETPVIQDPVAAPLDAQEPFETTSRNVGFGKAEQPVFDQGRSENVDL